ncbi:MAG: Unknown protein [uncultured Sulfurovum sp.]|uniref:Porin domain-containing protein n=1 Tax=uncultured Sulfurovum sp. TaxID=269237 RepID=A0A6S6TQW4_9BACT|nr:MAG: Unknown protein [uncultured Sulfurovum sp.]
MKITKLSLAAIAAMTITTGAMAEGWAHTGQAVAYTQTVDQSGNGDLFGSDSTYGAVGLQLGAVNKNLFNGVGAGVEVSGIHNDDGQAGGFYGGGGNAGTTSGGVTQAYLTYGAGNTSFKLGRQQLPKSLSPFAYSEGWQIFKNTYDAARVVNTDIENTTLVYAYVKNSNRSVGAYADEDSFTGLAAGAINDGVHMIAASTKAIPNATVTGTAYQTSDVTTYGDTTVLWVDAKTKVGPVGVALQGGQMSVDAAGRDDTSAFGAKVSGKAGPVNLSLAYSKVGGDGTGLGVTNLGTGVKSPLYTQMVLNNVGQYHARQGAEFTKLFATTKAGGGTVKAGYGMGTNDNNSATDYSEFDLMYVKKLTPNTKVFAAYVRTNDDGAAATGSIPNDNNFVRVWGRYSF